MQPLLRVDRANLPGHHRAGREREQGMRWEEHLVREGKYL